MGLSRDTKMKRVEEGFNRTEDYTWQKVDKPYVAAAGNVLAVSGDHGYRVAPFDVNMADYGIRTGESTAESTTLNMSR